jgi:hypothetical protein
MSNPIIVNVVPKKGVVVFSGGSAANSLVDVFDEVLEKNNSSLSYIIPISDNGGSSSELIRVFGGPGIGDVRSTSQVHCCPIFCLLFSFCFLAAKLLHIFRLSLLYRCVSMHLESKLLLLYIL